MNMRPAITAALLAFSLLPAAAQEPTPKAEEGKKPSEILAFVEASLLDHDLGAPEVTSGELLVDMESSRASSGTK